MTIAKFIEELNDKFYPCNELVFVCGEDRDLKPTMEYEGDKAKIEIDYCPGEDWELIADGYLNCLHEILEICDEKNLSNPKKIEAIRRRLNEEI